MRAPYWILVLICFHYSFPAVGLGSLYHSNKLVPRCHHEADRDQEAEGGGAARQAPGAGAGRPGAQDRAHREAVVRPGGRTGWGEHPGADPDTARHPGTGASGGTSTAGGTGSGRITSRSRWCPCAEGTSLQQRADRLWDTDWGWDCSWSGSQVSRRGAGQRQSFLWVQRGDTIQEVNNPSQSNFIHMALLMHKQHKVQWKEATKTSAQYKYCHWSLS